MMTGSAAQGTINLNRGIVIQQVNGGRTTTFKLSPGNKLVALSSEQDWLRYAQWKRLRKLWHIVEALTPFVTRDVALVVHRLLWEPLLRHMSIAGTTSRTAVPIYMGKTPLRVIHQLLPRGTYWDLENLTGLFRCEVAHTALGGLSLTYDQVITVGKKKMINCTTNTVEIHHRCVDDEWTLLDYLIMLAEREQLDGLFSGPC